MCTQLLEKVVLCNIYRYLKFYADFKLSSFFKKQRFVTFTYSKPENISDHVIAKHLKEGIQQSHILAKWYPPKKIQQSKINN